jgi:hypothetical protein
MSDFYDILEEYEQQESMGGGIVGKILVQLGWKSFIPGMGNEETFFHYTPGDEASKKAAKEQCQNLITQSGVPNRPQNCIQFQVYRDSVLGRDVTWQGDRFFVHPLWTDGYKQIVKPAMKAAGMTTVGEYWGRIAFADDPSGRMEEDREGNPRVAQIPHLVEIYPSKEAAQKAVEGGAAASPEGGETVDTGVPPGWTKDAWDSVKSDIQKAKDDGQAPPTIASDYGVEVKYIVQALSG